MTSARNKKPSSQVKMADDIRSARSVRVQQASSFQRSCNAVFTTSSTPTSRLIATSKHATTNEIDGIADEGESSVDCNKNQAVNMPERRTAGIFGFYTIDARTGSTSTTKGTAGLRGETSLNPDTERTYDVSCVESISTSTSTICTASITIADLGEDVRLQKQDVDPLLRNINTVVPYTVERKNIGLRRSTLKKYGVHFPWDRGKYPRVTVTRGVKYRSKGDRTNNKLRYVDLRDNPYVT